MKRFILTILGVSVFFVGLGAIIDRAGAKFKSDEKALALIKAARVAIGGDDAIASVQSLRIVGQTTQTFKVNGADRTEQGETEIALQLPDKVMKMIKIGHDDGTGKEQKIVDRRVDVVVVGKDEAGKAVVKGEGQGEGTGVQKIVVTKGDGPVQEINTADGKKIIVRQAEPGDNVEWKTEGGDTKRFRVEREQAEAHFASMRQNEILRLTLALLISAPQGMDVNYTYGGESDVDGMPCNVVVAEFGGASIKLFLNRDTNLPAMIAYRGSARPKVVEFNKELPAPPDSSKDVMFFKRLENGPGDVDFQVRFSDYRSVNGVQFPYHWTTTANGALDETFDVATYEVNPPNIAEKFQREKVFVRMKEKQ